MMIYKIIYHFNIFYFHPSAYFSEFLSHNIFCGLIGFPRQKSPTDYMRVVSSTYIKKLNLSDVLTKSLI